MTQHSLALSPQRPHPPGGTDGTSQGDPKNELVAQRPKGFPDSDPPSSAAATPAGAPLSSTPLDTPSDEAPGIGSGPAPASVDLAPPPSLPPSTLASSPPNLRKDNAPSPDNPIEHRGFVLEALVGTIGCTRSMCAGAEGHDGKPSVSFAGFLGGNIAGFVDIGLEGGWGRLRANVPENTNALSLYGIDAQQLELAIAQQLGIPAPVMNFNTMSVDDARMEAARSGVAVRVHFIPRGRVSAFVGSGAEYQLLRNTYSSERGTSRVDLHGIAIPISGGFGVHLYHHIALMARFDYLWSRHLLLRIDDPQTQFVAPLAMVQSANPSTNLNKTLPHFWNLGLGLRANF